MSIFVNDKLAKEILERCANNGITKSAISLDFKGYNESVINQCCKELVEIGAIDYSETRHLSGNKWYPTSITINGREILRRLSRTWRDKVRENIIKESGKLFWGLVGVGVTELFRYLIK